MNQSFSFAARMRSFRYAVAGIALLLRDEHNARIHLVAALFVVIAAWWLGAGSVQWALLILCIGGVLLAEAMNSAVEYLGDAVSEEQHPLIGKAKDVAAGGVLLMSIAAAVVGAMVFVPLLLAR